MTVDIILKCVEILLIGVLVVLKIMDLKEAKEDEAQDEGEH